jgi:hypothetical protein
MSDIHHPGKSGCLSVDVATLGGLNTLKPDSFSSVNEILLARWWQQV